MYSQIQGTSSYIKRNTDGVAAAVHKLHHQTLVATQIPSSPLLSLKTPFSFDLMTANVQV